MIGKMMRAARYYGKEDVRIENTERPVLLPGQVLIKPSFVGICGTDLHEYIAGPTLVLLLFLTFFPAAPQTL
jgi:threonine dehydrogenase-like Zn-dependent dehydrogenase